MLFCLFFLNVKLDFSFLFCGIWGKIFLRIEMKNINHTWINFIKTHSFFVYSIYRNISEEKGSWRYTIRYFEYLYGKKSFKKKHRFKSQSRLFFFFYFILLLITNQDVTRTEIWQIPTPLNTFFYLNGILKTIKIKPFKRMDITIIL